MEHVDESRMPSAFLIRTNAMMPSGRTLILFDPKQETPNYTQLDERTDYFYEAVTAAAGMVSTTPGVGSAYLGAYKDRNNRWFDGSKTYRLHVPPNAPGQELLVADDLRHVQPRSNRYPDAGRRHLLMQGGTEEGTQTAR